jgi:2-polyprenyl-3-methyl-5-hydroxy-6-metoxy-1,4-benzoquinol methylase
MRTEKPHYIEFKGSCSMNKPEIFWNKSAASYDRTEARFEQIHQTSRECAKKHLKNSDIVMDYGCGTGTTACELASHVNEIQAIDISRRMIELSKKKAVAKGVKNIRFSEADIFDDAYGKESFDVVLAFNMLHTVPDPQRVIARVHELLRPDGSFISVTPCLRDKMSFVVSAQIQIVRLLCKIGIIPFPIRRLRSSDLDSLLGGGNFHTTETREIYSGASSYFVVAKKSTS